MSVDRLLNALKQHNEAMLSALGQPRFGIVASYDSNTGAAKVRIQPEDVLTGWLPVLSHWVGAGWGMHAPLSGGEQVLMVMQEGDGEHGIIVGRAWSDAMRPPAAAPGELWLVHQSGALVKLTGDGRITLKDAAGTAATFANNGTMVVTGDLVVSGDISDQGTTHGSLAALRTAYNAHHHPGVQPGGASTGTTDDPVA